MMRRLRPSWTGRASGPCSGGIPSSEGEFSGLRQRSHAVTRSSPPRSKVLKNKNRVLLRSSEMRRFRVRVASDFLD
jgi:hypothetical protein